MKKVTPLRPPIPGRSLVALLPCSLTSPSLAVPFVPLCLDPSVPSYNTSPSIPNTSSPIPAAALIFASVFVAGFFCDGGSHVN